MPHRFSRLNNVKIMHKAELVPVLQLSEFERAAIGNKLMTEQQ